LIGIPSRTRFAGDAERRVRGAGLDWAYLPLLVEDGHVEEAVRGLAALGFVGANVTAPHKAAAAAVSDTDLDSVNTLVVRDGRVEGYSTDAAVLDGLAADRPVDPRIRRGGRRVPRGTSRRACLLAPGRLAADVSDTGPRCQRHVRTGRRPLRPVRGQTLIDLPYPVTATGLAAREAGARVITAECSSRKAPRRSSSGRACPRPVEVMRAP